MKVLVKVGLFVAPPSIGAMFEALKSTTELQTAASCARSAAKNIPLQTAVAVWARVAVKGGGPLHDALGTMLPRYSIIHSRVT